MLLSAHDQLAEYNSLRSLTDARKKLAITAAAILTGICFEARASSIQAKVDGNSKLPYAFKGFPIPTRETLLANAPLWDITLRRRQRHGPSPFDCSSELSALRDGFMETYANAPKDARASRSWTVHIAMIHFPHVYLCSLRHRINQSLKAIEKDKLQVAPLPQRINVGSFDFTAYDRLPKHVQWLQHDAGDLFWMSYRGSRPAMLELLKLADRSSVVRLTTRFKFYLLQCAIDAKFEDPLIDELEVRLTKMVSDAEIEELRDRAQSRMWPRSERMVID